MAEWWKELFDKDKEIKAEIVDLTPLGPLRDIDKKCRICHEPVLEECYEVLFFGQNITELGRKYCMIMEFPEEEEEMLSNTCCVDCGQKVQICFSLLIRIRTSDSIMRQICSDPQYDTELLDMKTQVFQCNECNSELVGLDNFIDHYQEHLITRTTSVDNVVEFSIAAPVEGEVTDPDPGPVFDDTYEELSEDDSRDDPNRVSGRVYLKDLKIKIDDDDYYNLIQDQEFGIFVQKSDFLDTFNEVEKKIIIDDINDMLEADVNNDEEDSDAELTEIVLKELEMESDTEGGSDPYKCRHVRCYQTFYSIGELSEHLKEHETSTKLLKTCKHCQDSMPYTDYLAHWKQCKRTFDSDHDYLCTFCGEMFKNYAEFLKHMRKHYRKIMMFQCNICKKKFTKKSSLEQHMPKHDESQKVTCEVCNMKMLPRSLKKHLKTHGEKDRVCEICGKGFIHNYLLEEHLITHALRDGYGFTGKCTKCDKVFESALEFEGHNREIHNTGRKKLKKNIKCKQCNEAFVSRAVLKYHQREEHGLNLQSFACQFCDSDFGDMVTYRCHLSNIHDIPWEDLKDLKSRPFPQKLHCEKCGQVEMSVNKMTIHMKKEHGSGQGEMNFLKKTCEKCGKTFANKQSLTTHIKSVHLNMRDLECKECGQTFTKYGSLIVHGYTHTGAKYFECEVCDKNFRQRNDALRHLSRHVRDGESTLEEAACRNTNDSKTVQKRRIFLKDSWLASSIQQEIKPRPHVSRILATNERGQITSIIFKASDGEIDESIDYIEDLEEVEFQVEGEDLNV